MFKLTKHYFDNIDTHGNLVIAYAAELSVLGITIPFSSVITLKEDGELQEKPLLKRAELHSQMGGRGFKQAELNAQGEWRSLANPLPEVELFQVEGKKDKVKSVKWHVHTPLAKCEFTKSDLSIKGLGYAETLTMDIEPWHLPLKELYWGRFLSPTHSVVWLEWRGENPIRLLYHDGMLQDDFKFKNNVITYEFGEIVLRDTRVIKDEPLVNLAAHFPMVKKLFKKEFFETREKKFVSRGTLTLHDGTPCEGFALYERVLWNSVK
ncbi:hypothetical protein [Alysiella crassa]|uniref:Uncharacterized protein n=1 Tax=Alysiella crassa TaxID=153491 RepID=A0A376BRM2_9NEIS|nr:hypothetical protein [Alysiella crassa]SSY79549.1 Uncharacterised protein [Alysiella crassa]